MARSLTLCFQRQLVDAEIFHAIKRLGIKADILN